MNAYTIQYRNGKPLIPHVSRYSGAEILDMDRDAIHRWLRWGRAEKETQRAQDELVAKKPPHLKPKFMGI